MFDANTIEKICNAVGSVGTYSPASVWTELSDDLKTEDLRAFLDWVSDDSSRFFGITNLNAKYSEWQKTQFKLSPEDLANEILQFGRV